MAIRNIRRQSANPGGYAATANAAPVYVDSATNILKIIPAGSGTTEVQIIDASSAQTLTGKSLGNTLNIPGKTTAITNASATALVDVARANNVAASGVIFYEAVVTDGTDFQTITGMVTYAHVDKAGTGTFTITEVAGNQAKAVSTGTYTLAWTYVTGTAKGTIKLQPTSSLTATVHTVTFTIFPIAGTVTIL